MRAIPKKLIITQFHPQSHRKTRPIKVESKSMKTINKDPFKIQPKIETTHQLQNVNVRKNEIFLKKKTLDR